jgi:hypothetical protein
VVDLFGFCHLLSARCKTPYRRKAMIQLFVIAANAVAMTGCMSKPQTVTSLCVATTPESTAFTVSIQHSYDGYEAVSVRYRAFGGWGPWKPIPSVKKNCTGKCSDCIKNPTTAVPIVQAVCTNLDAQIRFWNVLQIKEQIGTLRFQPGPCFDMVCCYE